jgi:hypothetical protein
MADYVTRIRTSSGNKQIDYNALANLPNLLELDADLTASGKAADAKVVGDKITQLTNEKATITYVDGKTQELQAAVDNVSLDTLGVTATAEELNYISGVTSNVQEQLNSKQQTIIGAASTIVEKNIAADRVLISNGDGKVDAANISVTELNSLAGINPDVDVQSQLNDLKTLMDKGYDAHEDKFKEVNETIQTMNDTHIFAAVLWENLNPDAEFAQQDLEINGILDSKLYPYLMIISSLGSVFVPNQALSTVRLDATVISTTVAGDSANVLSFHDRRITLSENKLSIGGNVNWQIVTNDFSAFNKMTLGISNQYNIPLTVIGCSGFVNVNSGEGETPEEDDA